MSTYPSRGELLAKIDWEGGIWQMLFEYGLKPNDMPDPELYDLMKQIHKRLEPLQDLVYEFMERLEDTNATKK